MDPRNQATIHKNTGFELDQLRMSAVISSELADVWSLPVVNRNLERRAGSHARHEAGHNGHPGGPVQVEQFVVGNYLTSDPKLLERYSRVPAGGEENDIPIFESHDAMSIKPIASNRWCCWCYGVFGLRRPNTDEEAREMNKKSRINDKNDQLPGTKKLATSRRWGHDVNHRTMFDNRHRGATWVFVPSLRGYEVTYILSKMEHGGQSGPAAFNRA